MAAQMIKSKASLFLSFSTVVLLVHNLDNKNFNQISSIKLGIPNDLINTNYFNHYFSTCSAFFQIFSTLKFFIKKNC